MRSISRIYIPFSIICMNKIDWFWDPKVGDLDGGALWGLILIFVCLFGLRQQIWGTRNYRQDKKFTFYCIYLFISKHADMSCGCCLFYTDMFLHVLISRFQYFSYLTKWTFLAAFISLAILLIFNFYWMLQIVFFLWVTQNHVHKKWVDFNVYTVFTLSNNALGRRLFCT